MDINELRGLLREGYGGRQLTALHTEKTDSLLKGIFSSVGLRSGLCLIAVGGYGRAELAPHSDIDVMLFARDRSGSGDAEALLYRLWDTNLMIGHSFRTPDDCIGEAKRDVRTRTSLLEHRYVAGDRDLYHYFMENVYPEIAFRESKKFISEKLREIDERHRKIADSVFMLEPHIKEGRGSLRDIHAIIWLASVKMRIRHFDELKKILTAEDFRKIEKAYDFLLKVRFCLHLLSGRRNDILSFEFHDGIAELLDFKVSPKYLASERFMRYLYMKASVVNEIVSRALDLFSTPYRDPETGRESRVAHFFYAKRRLTDDFSLSKNRIVANGASFRKTPEKIIGAFAVMSRTGKKFSPALKDGIKKDLFRVGRTTRRSHRAAESFMDLMRSERIYDTLREMHDSGVLGRYIPEFGALRFLVVYEPYHRYTVDEHTLHAIKRIEELGTTRYRSLEHLSSVFRGARHREALFLSLLLHDIGKRGILQDYRYGSGGRHHEDLGYRELKSIIERFGLSVEVRSLVEFLVKNHLLMSSVAFKEETDDPEVIARFADDVGDRESLDALYVLTYADMAAVNEGFWTDWKAYQLKELYETTSRYLEGARPEELKTLLSIPGLTQNEKVAIGRFLASMPKRYVISATPERAYEDFRLSREVAEKGFGLRVREDLSESAELVVGAWDRPGLFSRIVGVLSSMRMNIYRARLFTGSDGIVIDKIQVSNWGDLAWEGLVPALEERLRGAASPAERGTGPGEYGKFIRRIRDSQGYISPSPEVFGRFGPFIEIDNESSAENSILEFFSRDRLWLLYDVTSLLHDRDIDIISARINTDSGIAHDLFSLQYSGEKIEGEMVQALLLALWESLG